LVCFKCDAANSPDTNPIENIFGAAELQLAKQHVKKRAQNVKEWCTRFENVLKDLENNGSIERTVRTMPKRCRVLIDKEGGPTGW
jgi:hypothetical protein